MSVGRLVRIIMLVVMVSLVLTWVSPGSMWRADAAAWAGSVTLSAPKTTMTNNDSPVTLSVNWSPASGLTSSVAVYDENWNRIWSFGSGTTSGSLSVKPPANASHTYTAYVATSPNPGPPTGILAISTPITISNTGYAGSVMLSASRTVVTADSPSQTLSLSATPVPSTPYMLSVYDDLGTRIYYSTGSETYGSLVVAPAVGATRTYTAYVAQGIPPNPGPPTADVRVTSSVSVTNAGYLGTVTLAVDRSQLDGSHASAHLTLATSSAVAASLYLSVYDHSGSLVYYSKSYSSTGSLTLTLPANTTRVYTAYVSTTAPAPGPPPSSFASSNSVYVTSIAAGDNILGMSIPVLEAGAAARYAANATEMCVAVGEAEPYTPPGTSVPAATTACLGGGVRGLATYLVSAIGAAASTAVLWDLIYSADGGTPAPAGQTPLLPAPRPVDAPIDAALTGQLTDRLMWRTTNVGTGPTTGRVPDEQYVTQAAFRCLELARKPTSGVDARGCWDKTIFMPGVDAQGAAKNDLAAIVNGPAPAQLHYVSTSDANDRQKRVPAGWYNSASNSTPGCSPDQKPAGFQCDEFPLRSSNEAGPPLARLAWVSRAENGMEGSMAGAMVVACGLVSGDDPPLPGRAVNGSHYLVLPLPYTLPLTTFICGQDIGNE